MYRCRCGSCGGVVDRWRSGVWSVSLGVLGGDGIVGAVVVARLIYSRRVG